MTHSQPHITGTTHTLPSDKLSPRGFERLCLWLVEREGYERAEHLGAAGSEQGRDIVAWREGRLWAFQCKRVQRFGPKDALEEVGKVLALPEDQRPVGLVFLVTCDVSANTRQQVRDRCAGEMECRFWAGTELDQKVKQYPDIVNEFFQADRGATISNVIQIGKVVVQFVDDKVLKRIGLGQQVGFILLSVLVTVIGVGTAFFLYQTLRPQSPSRMTGDFRIVVAGFAEKGRSGDSEIGTELAQGVYLRLEQTFDELDLGFTVTIWGPDRVGTIKGQSHDERANTAAQVTQEIGADVIVYGWVDTTDAVWQVNPEFYVSAQNFYEAEEITGQHDMGAPLSVTGQDNVVARIAVSEEFTTRTQALAEITVGLAYYSVRGFEQALAFFQSAEEIEGWQDSEGKQVLYLLIGNAAGKSGDLELAETYHKRSLSLDPKYARAKVGLAGVYYMRALELFEETLNPADIDSEQVNLAIATYQQAAQATHRPALSDVTTKVHFGLGQCYLLHVYSGEETSFYTAVEEFQAVIEAYADGANPRVRELAAESHARLGLIYDLAGDTELAVEEYQTAVSLLYNNPDRQRVYTQRVQALRDGIDTGDP